MPAHGGQPMGLGDVVATLTGSRAGDPFGDCIFNAIMGEIVQGITATLMDMGLVAHPRWEGRR